MAFIAQSSFRTIKFYDKIKEIKDKDKKLAFSSEDGVGAYCAGRCQVHGLIVRQLGNTIALCPPLIVTTQDIDEIFDIMELALDESLSWAGQKGLFA